MDLEQNALLNLIRQYADIDKIFIYPEGPCEAICWLLINQRKGTNLKYLDDSKAFIKCSNSVNDIYENIDECTPDKKRKKLIVFDDMIADILSNKKLNPKNLFIRGRKLRISPLIITQLYFAVAKDIRLNVTHYFVMKIPKKMLDV